MLVSSIGYFNQRGVSLRDYSSKNQGSRINSSAGFGQVNEVNVPKNKNIFVMLADSIKSVFSSNKQDLNSKKSFSA